MNCFDDNDGRNTEKRTKMGVSKKNCDFDLCPTTGPDYILCPETRREADYCINLNQPVCAFVNVECITTPCEPVPETFPNSCFACSNSRVDFYLKGECIQQNS